MLNYFFHPELLPFVINWEAWATFSVGCLAVAGAFLIGRAQVRIVGEQVNAAERQNAILGQQVELGALAVRQTFFDRRTAVYEAAEYFRHTAMMHSGDAGEQAWSKMLEERAKSQFLFNSELHVLLDKLIRLAQDIHKEHLRFVKSGEPSKDMTPDEHRIFALQEELKVAFAPYFQLVEPMPHVTSGLP